MGVPGSNPGGPIIFQRKNEGRKANPRGAGNEDRQGKVGGGQSRRFFSGVMIFQRKNKGRKANPGPTTSRSSVT